MLINAHKRELIKQFKLNSAIILAMDQKNFVPLDTRSEYTKHAKLSILLEHLLLTRVNEYLIGDDFEGISVIIN